MSNSNKKILLTGITPSGEPHLGNYIGAIRPAIKLSKSSDYISRYFISDYHSLVKLWDANLRNEYTYSIAASWLACGLNPNKVLFYRQSDIPEIMELNWILSTVSAKGLLNRAHAYKSQVDTNTHMTENDPDKGITMGLFNYPVLMAADILAFGANMVPVGKDQIQHIEIARDIANRFNHIYKSKTLTPPEAYIDNNSETILGLDGRKMSKSYGNTIPLFSSEKQLRKAIMRIKTNSLLPGEPKETNNCTVYKLYQSFASKVESENFRPQYEKGIGWGEAKQILYEKINTELSPYRTEYNSLIQDKEKIDLILKDGAKKAREITIPLINRIRADIGI
jgi:tryptophanyl-tRNA synthetase